MIFFADRYFTTLIECNNSDLHILFYMKNMKKTFLQDLNMCNHEDIEKLISLSQFITLVNLIHD